MSRVLLGLLVRLPCRVAWAAAWALSWTWWSLVRTRRSLAVENLRQALPEAPPGPVLRTMMQELILAMWEGLRHRHRILPGLTFVGLERLEERAGKGEGSLVLTGHAGAWELFAFAAAREHGLPVTLIARPPTWGPARRLLREARTGAGMEILPPERSIWRVLAALREGRVVVFLLDQRHNQGQPVPFLAERPGPPAHSRWSQPEAAARCLGLGPGERVWVATGLWSRLRWKRRGTWSEIPPSSCPFTRRTLQRVRPLGFGSMIGGGARRWRREYSPRGACSPCLSGVRGGIRRHGAGVALPPLPEGVPGPGWRSGAVACPGPQGSLDGRGRGRRKPAPEIGACRARPGSKAPLQEAEAAVVSAS